MTDDAKTLETVAERLRFFFSDANIRGDKFMRRELEGSENGDVGYVNIDLLLRFNSIKKHTTDAKVVAAAAKHDSLKDIVKLNADENAIGRVTTFDKEKMLDNVRLSLRVDNVPVTAGDDPKYAVTVDDLKKLFSEFGTVTLIRLQRHKPHNNGGNGGEDLSRYGRQTAVPTGAAFVEFDTEEQQKKALADLIGEGDTEPSKTLEIGGKKLKIQAMRTWIDEKETRKTERRGGRSPNKRDRDDNGGEGGGGGEKGGKKAKYEEFTLDWKKGRAIAIKGLGGECDREAICEAVAKFLGVDTDSDNKTLGIYADYSRGQPDGAIRFHNDKVGDIEGDAISEKVKEIAAKFSDGTITVRGAKVESATLLEGEEEDKYYKNFIDFKNKQRKQKAESNGRGGRKKFRSRD